jgi:cytochrome P450
VGWITRPAPFLERAAARYGDAFTLHVSPAGPWVVLAHPDAIRQVLTADPATLHAGEANAVLRPVLGRHSVLLLDDAPHLAQRRLLSPPFHGARIQRYGGLVREIAEREVASWPAGRALALHPRMQALTLEVILRAVLGVREAERAARLRAALRGLLDWVADPRRMLAVALLGPDRVERIGLLRGVLAAVDAELGAEIARRRADPDLAEREDVLSLLLQATHADGRPLADRELRDELLTLLLAGHETTATALAWALERLLRHPAAWERLREEVAAGERAYVAAVVRETLRVRPVVAAVVRRLLAPMEVSGLALPAGTLVAPSILLVHRRPDLYPEPHAFRPERFLGRAPGAAWIPFGGGLRRCLGAAFALLEMETVLAVVAARARLRPEDARPERTARRTVTLAPGAGARAVVERPQARAAT